MGEGAFPGVHSSVAKLPLLGALPPALAEDKPLGPAPSPCPRAQHSSGLWGSAFGAAGWDEWPVEAKKALSDPSFGKASGFPPSCSPRSPIPRFSTPPSLSRPSWHAVLHSSPFPGFSASSAVLCSLTAPLPPLQSCSSTSPPFRALSCAASPIPALLTLHGAAV